MFFRKIAAFSAALFLLSLSITSLVNAQNTVNLIKGTVIDDASGKPLGADLFFINSKGKKVPTKSNSSDGSFQQVLPVGETYTVIAKNYIVPVGQSTFSISQTSQYSEVTKDFRLKKIASGMELFEFNAFNPNDSAIILTKAYPFESLKDFLANNMKVNVQIAVSTQDSYFKPTKKSVKVQDKKKTKTKTVTVSAEEQLRTLAEARINAIRDYLSSLKVPERSILFRQDIKSGKAAVATKAPAAKKGKKDKTIAQSSYSPVTTVKITVSKVLDLD